MKKRWAFWLILFCCILVLLIIAAQFAWSWDPRANSIPAVSEPAPSAALSSSSETAVSTSRWGAAAAVRRGGVRRFLPFRLGFRRARGSGGAGGDGRDFRGIR